MKFHYIVSKDTLMPTFNGVCVYEILPNGCLNGVYSNDHPATNNEMYNEIARKIRDLEPISDPIIGEYVCSYIDLGNNVHTCTLIIHNQPKRVPNGQYHFEWWRDGTNIFEGTGWRTRENQITVSYRDIP